MSTRSVGRTWSIAWMLPPLASLVCAFFVPGAAPGAVAAPSPNAQEITLVLQEYSFTPKAITLRAGTPVKFVLVNRGNRDHEFQVYPVPQVSPQDWNSYAMTHTYFKNMGEIDVALPGEAEIGMTALFKVHVAPGARVTLWFTPRAKGVFEMASHDPGQFEKGLKGTVVVK
jgi:uncharacterized cupredoxin-like copper-binding protein